MVSAVLPPILRRALLYTRIICQDFIYIYYWLRFVYEIAIVGNKNAAITNNETIRYLLTRESDRIKRVFYLYGIFLANYEPRLIVRRGASIRAMTELWKYSILAPLFFPRKSSRSFLYIIYYLLMIGAERAVGIYWTRTSLSPLKKIFQLIYRQRVSSRSCCATR